jgi:putative ABC transport system permease protein
MKEEIASSLAPRRVVQGVVTAAGVIALLLAAGGLYGLLAYNLETWLKEIGVRIALGATGPTLFGLIVGRVVRLTAVGIVVGAAMAVGATRVAAAMLYGVSPTDVLTFAGVGALLPRHTRRGVDHHPAGPQGRSRRAAARVTRLSEGRIVVSGPGLTAS